MRAPSESRRDNLDTMTDNETAQSEVAPPAMLCWNMTAGPAPVAAGAVGPKLILFFSAVKPCAMQFGAPVPP